MSDMMIASAVIDVAAKNGITIEVDQYGLPLDSDSVVRMVNHPSGSQRYRLRGNYNIMGDVFHVRQYRIEETPMDVTHPEYEF